jgi:glycosyl hydrolase family 10
MTLFRFAALLFILPGAASAQVSQDWTHYVRIAGHGLRLDSADQIIRSATDTNVFGIEVDNDIPGRYESFLDPSEKLKALREVARKAHEAGNYAFVYIAGTECITAKAASSAHSMAKDHPDWLQRKITGEPALFGGGSAFWIREGDEDVWITPFAPEWRKIYMQHVRQIAATGIDGVYVDIPYWMTHFAGWEDSWVSFDDYTVTAFKAKTGLNAKTDLKLGDFHDANFRKWVDFRIDALTDFVREIDANVKAVNPKCKTIPEIYPGIEESAVRVGSDVYELYRVVDTIAHEYSTGGRAAARTPLAWFQDMVGMYSFRAFAGSKPSWMLSYSWEKEQQIVPGEAMKNLAMAQLMAGTNTWDAQGHVMSGSNDIQTRKVIFGWMKEHEKTFFSPRQPVQPIGVYFSPKSRDYFAKEFIESYRGIMMLLLQSHLEFQIVTPRTLSAFHEDMLILPDARCLGKEEVDSLGSYAGSGKTLIVTGETGKYDETGASRDSNPVHRLLGITDPGEKKAGKKFIYYPNCPGRAYYAQLRKDFDQQAAAGAWEEAEFNTLRKVFVAEILEVSGLHPTVQIDASPFVSTQIAGVGGKVSIFLANFKGLKSKEVAQQTPEQNVTVAFSASGAGTIAFLPFLGQLQKVPGTFSHGKLTAKLPPIDKGAVVWVE